jgi:hypothetical protein
MLGRRELIWKGDRLMLGTRNTGVKIIPDAKWSKMFRVEYPPGVISDMVSLTRARDAAVSIVAHHLSQEARVSKNATPGPNLDPRKTGLEAPYSDYSALEGVKYRPTASGVTQPSSHYILS